MKITRTVVRMALGGAVCGMPIGVGVGALLGTSYGVLIGNTALGFNGAFIGGCVLALVGTVIGAMFGLDEESVRHNHVRNARTEEMIQSKTQTLVVIHFDVCRR